MISIKSLDMHSFSEGDKLNAKLNYKKENNFASFKKQFRKRARKNVFNVSKAKTRKTENLCLVLRKWRKDKQENCIKRSEKGFEKLKAYKRICWDAVLELLCSSKTCCKLGKKICVFVWKMFDCDVHKENNFQFSLLVR